VRYAVAALAVLAVAGCGGGSDDGGSRVPEEFHLESSSFRDGGALPSRFTCDGRGLSPPLRWKGVPTKARDLALIVEDRDVPVGAFTHWTIWRLPFGPVGTGRIFETDVPNGAVEGRNDSGDTGWAPACPPKADGPHHYFFTIYALERPAELVPNASATQVRAAVTTSSLAEASISATYDR